MAKTLQQLEKEFYQTATGRGGYLGDHKKQVFQTSFPGEGETLFLRQFISDHGGDVTNLNYDGDLWRAAVAITGQTPSVRISENKRLLYQSPIAKLYYNIRSLDGLVAYYPLNETSGTTAFNRNPDSLGTLDGTTTGATVGQTGQVGKAYSFDGTNDKVVITDNDVLDGFSQITILFMISADDTAVFRKVFYKGSVYDIGVSDVGVIFGELVGVHNFGGFNDTVIDDGIWRMIVITYDGTTATAYINGTQVEQATGLTGNIATSASNLVLGNNDGTEWMKGKMQHIALLNKAITPSQALKLAELAGLA